MKLFNFFFLTFLALSCSADPASSAQSLYDSLKGGFNTAEKVSKNLQNPITTGSTMTNLDGSNTFTAQFSCSAESNYLTVTATSGSFNRISSTIQMDTDLNGSMEYTRGFYDMSSVCNNGYVSCPSSSIDFPTCRHVEITYDGTTFNEQTLHSPENRAKLFGCECYHSACGPNLSNIDGLGKASAKLATHLSTLVANHNPRFIASRVETSGNTTKYYGKDVTSCAPADSSGASTIQDFSNAKRSDDDSYIISAGISALSSSPPDSPASSLQTQISNSRTDTHTSHTCRVRRHMYYPSVPSTSFETRFSLFSQGRNFIRCSYSLANGTASCSSDGNNVQYDFGPIVDYSQWCAPQTTVQLEGRSDWIHGVSGLYGQPDGSIDWYYHQTPSCQNNLTGDFEIRDRTTGSDLTHFLTNSLYYKIIKPASCILNENIIDNCATYSTPNCTLLEETVDGIKTVFNTVQTGSTTTPYSDVISNTSGCSSTVTRDWYLKERTYLCSSSSPSFNPNTSHLSEPIITGNSATIDIGGVTHNLSRPAVSTPTCQQVCEVQTTVLDTQTNIEGHASDIRLDPTRLKKVFKACENDICPTASGETIIKPCGCSNNFAKAATTMQMLRLAGKDFICTSN